MTLAVKDLGEASNLKESKAWWKFVWNLNVPPKVKLFVGCKNWLSMHYNLSKMGMSVNPFCFMCGLTLELVCHCLWNCPSMKPVWKRCYSHYDSTKVQDVWDLLEHLVLNAKKIFSLDFEHFLVLS